MNLNDLIGDALGDGMVAAECRVFLATKTSENGHRFEDGSVKVAEVGELKVDETFREVHMIPEPGAKRAVSVEDCMNVAARDAPCGEYLLLARMMEARNKSGAGIISTTPIVASWCHPKNGQIWLLLHPKDQWREEGLV